MKNYIKELRSKFKKYEIDGYVIPKNDDYFTEYSKLNRLEVISNFSGSAGLAIILKNKNYLFTDGRYTIQSKIESGKNFKIYGFEKLINCNLFKNLTLGIDPKLFTSSQIKNFFLKNNKIKYINKNLIDEIKKQREDFKISFFSLNKNIVGESVGSKINKISKYLKKYKSDYIFISAPENVAWILNIRGGEYKRHRELILPKSYWVNAIKNMKKRNPNLKFRIVTDDKNYAKKLLPNIEIIGGNISSDFYALYKARFLIISNSSFSYFPITLEEKPDYVIAPLYWSRYGNKYNKWSSPANCYEGWIWQNNEGKILSKNEVINSLINSRNKYKDFKLRHYSKDIYMEKKDSKLVIFIKRILKLILSIFFPLKYG